MTEKQGTKGGWQLVLSTSELNCGDDLPYCYAKGQL